MGPPSKEDATSNSTKGSPPNSPAQDQFLPSSKEVTTTNGLKKRHNKDVKLPPKSATSVRPKKATHFGKANPQRDICLFLGFLIFMLLVSYLFQETGEPEDPKNKKPKLPSLADLRQYQRVLERTFEQGQTHGFSPDSECSLFLGKSSIPNAGWGVFANGEISPGEEILGSSKTASWTLSLEDIQLKSGVTERGNNKKDGRGDFSTRQMIPSYSLLLKPHSILFNAEWSYDPSTSSSKLIATKPIAASSEIFLKWEDHPYVEFSQLFVNVPTRDQFKRADAIIHDSLEVFTTVGNRIQKRRVPDVNKGLQVLRKALDRYDRNVAGLVPLTASDLLVYVNKTKTSELTALKQQSLPSLADSSRCLTNINWIQKSQHDNGGNSLGSETTAAMPSSSMQLTVSREYIKEGELIMPVPLLLHRTGNGDSAEFQRQHNDSSEFCDLSPDMLTSLLPSASSESFCSSLRNFQGMDLGFSLCSLNGFAETTTDPQEANARYQWSARSDHHIKFLKDLISLSTSMPSAEVIQKHSLSMSWDLVAVREIARDEVIKVLKEGEEL